MYVGMYVVSIDVASMTSQGEVGPIALVRISTKLEVLHSRRGATYVNVRCYSVDPM